MKVQAAMFRAVVLAPLLLAANARAEGPWVVTFAAGPAVQRATEGLTVERSFTPGASASLDTGYRVLDTEAVGLALGQHLGIAYVRSRMYPNAEQAEIDDVASIPFMVGIGAQLVIADRVEVAPWLGMTYLDGSTFRSGGVELGFDIHVEGPERITAVATYLRAGHGDGFGLESIGAGIAYRYW